MYIYIYKIKYTHAFTYMYSNDRTSTFIVKTIIFDDN